MTRRFPVASLVLVLLTALSARADVAPFPSWRLAANGTIASAVQAGSTIYVGGSFSKIGRAITPVAGLLDPATLAITTTSGCATRSGSPMAGPYVDYPTALADGDGPFTVPAATALVRVGPNCRFDRRFRVELPAGAFADPTLVAEVAGRLYFSVFIGTGVPSNPLLVYVAEADAVTGAILRSWDMAANPGLRIAGAVAGGRVLATSATGNGSQTIGWFNPAQGVYQAQRTLLSDSSIVHAGDVVVTKRFDNGGSVLTAFDAATLAPLAQWPIVATSGPDTPIVASDAARVYIAGSAVSVDGAPAPRLLAFDALTGARLGAFSAPAWLDDPRGSFAMMQRSGSRLLVFGDFAPGAPRDTAAAVDVATGILDPWAPTYAAAPASLLGGRVYFPTITAVERVPRGGVAAVDERSGTVLAWTPTPAPPSPVTALAVDAVSNQLYTGGTGAVRRFALATAAEDVTWRLDLALGSQLSEAQPSAMALHQGVLYATGTFDRVRDVIGGAFQLREGAAAVAVTGLITAWRPMVEPVCLITPRPPLYGPCIRGLQAVDSRLVMIGAVRLLQAPGPPVRTLAAVTADTGAVDAFLPDVTTTVSSIAVDGTTLFAVGQLDQPTLVRVDVTSGARVVATLPRLSQLAVRGERVYADVERDAVSGGATGNPKAWVRPIAVSSGVLDAASAVLDWHGDVANVAPQAPTGVTAEVVGPRVLLRWSPGAGDLVPVVAPPPVGGTAATSYVVQASVAPGGPAVGAIDTASSETSWSLDAPPGSYYVRVAARNQFGISALSAEVAVHVVPSAPDRPTATRAVATVDTVQIEWTPSARGWRATSYVLDVGSAPGLADLGSLPVTATSFSASGVPPGRYYLRVRAMNASGASAASDEAMLVVMIPVGGHR